MATLKAVRSKQASRSRRARAADSHATSKSTFSTQNRDGLGRWVKNPRRHDVSGIDTKGRGKPGLSLKPSSMRRRR